MNTEKGFLCLFVLIGGEGKNQNEIAFLPDLLKIKSGY